MDRYSLTDTQWERIQPLCLGKKSDPGRTGGDTRLFLEAVLWIARTGSPWRDLPKHFGRWNTVFKRFRRWAVLRPSVTWNENFETNGVCPLSPCATLATAPFSNWIVATMLSKIGSPLCVKFPPSA